MSEADGAVLTAEPETTSWYGQDYGKLVETKGWKSPDDALRSYSELERTMGQRIKMPTPESSAEEIRAFYRKTGCPENPDGYNMKVPEHLTPLRDELMEGVMRQIAWDKGVSAQAFDAIAGRYYDAINEKALQIRQDGEKKLKEEWKDQFDENVKIAHRALDEYAKEDKNFDAFLETSRFGDFPPVVRFAQWVGRKLLSDTLIRGEQAEGGEEEYKPAYPDSPEMYRNGDDEDSKKARAWFEAKGYKY